MTRLSDFAIELNEAMDPGSMSPARLWAFEVARELRGAIRYASPWHGALRRAVAHHVAPNGDRFEVKFRGWDGDCREMDHFINGAPCDAREFEVRLAAHYQPTEPKKEPPPYVPWW